MLIAQPVDAAEITGLIGNTPLISLKKIAPECPANLLAKLEMQNPSGSIKDRLALGLIESAIANGELSPGGTVIEVTSGNTGISVAMLCAIMGYRAMIVMSDKNSEEKQNMMKLFGAELILTPHTVQADDPRSNYSVAQRLAGEVPDSVYLNQFDNPANIDCHYRTTAREIWEQTDGNIEAVIAGAGTGGTISGIGRFFKERDPAIKIIALDPEGSIFAHHYRTGQLKAGEHYEVEGIGGDRPVKALDYSVLDDMITVSDKEAFMMTRQIAQVEGVFGGGSSGSALVGTLKAVEKYGLTGNVVMIFADSGNRYLSKCYSDSWLKEKGYI